MVTGQRELDVSEVAIARLEVFAACFADRFLVGDAHPVIQDAMTSDFSSCSCITDVICGSICDFDDRLLEDLLV